MQSQIAAIYLISEDEKGNKRKRWQREEASIKARGSFSFFWLGGEILYLAAAHSSSFDWHQVMENVEMHFGVQKKNPLPIDPVGRQVQAKSIKLRGSNIQPLKGHGSIIDPRIIGFHGKVQPAFEQFFGSGQKMIHNIFSNPRAHQRIPPGVPQAVFVVYQDDAPDLSSGDHEFQLLPQVPRRLDARR